MPMPRLTALLVVSAVAAAAPPIRREGPFWVQTTEASQNLPAAAQLRIRGAGNITVHGREGRQLRYQLVRRVRARNAAEARARLAAFEGALVRRHGGLLLDLSRAAEGAAESDLHVTVPRGLPSLALNTLLGNLDVSDLDGSLQADTGAGTVAVHRVKGGVVVDTQGGATSLDEIGGRVRIDSAGGAILADLLRGDAVLATGGGDIVVQRVNGTLRAFTAGGGIRIRQAGGLVTATTAGGPIQVGAAPGVHCESGSGTIRLNDVSGAVHVETATGSIVAALLPGSGLRDSFLSTLDGDITVLIPANVRVMLRAENEGSGDVRSISSDFPGLRIRSDGGSVRAEGPINGPGGPVLRLAGSGRIYIKRRRGNSQ